MKSQFWSVYAKEPDSKIMGVLQVRAARHNMTLNESSNLEKHRAFIFEENKFIFTILSALGVFPFTIEKLGTLKLNYCSFKFIYTVTIILTGFIFAIFSANTVWTNLTTKKFTLESGYKYSCFMAFPIIQMITVLSFLEAKKVIVFFCDWTDFQVRFEAVTKHAMPNMPSMKTKFLLVLLSIIILIVFIAISEFNALSKIFLEHDMDICWHGVMALLTLYSGCLASAYSLYWMLFTQTVKHTSETILKDVESLNWMTHGSLQNHILLWMNLRQQCIGLGDVLSMTFLYLCSLVFGMSLPALYIGVTTNFTHLVSAVSSLMILSTLADISHSTVYAVGRHFQDRLTRLLLSGRAVSGHNELTSFIQTIASNPTTIVLGGYFTLDRGVNAPLYSSVITYLIVIAQFHKDYN